MITVTAHPVNHAVTQRHLDAARIVTISRAGRQYALLSHGRPLINGTSKH
jgi:hypothetical protein